ncbi:MAG: SUMF1/EgtB/PvdO family nonheme iron enzyme [Polyangiaceae bacterium]
MRSLGFVVCLALVGACASADPNASADPSDTDAGSDAGSAGDGGIADGSGWPSQDSAVDAPTAPTCSANGKAGTCLDVVDCPAPDWAPVPGFCDGPANIQCCVPVSTSSGTCDPDAHPLPNVGVTEAPGTGGCPSGMVPVDTFCIDRYEAHLVTYPDAQPVSPYFNPGGAAVMARSAAGAVPQGYINQVQAASACANAGKRLCTDAEWLRACGGPSATTYPYGSTLQSGVCNDHRAEHPAVEYFMTDDSWIWNELDHPCLNQLESSLALTGAYAGCTTSEGAFDMMGNLHEWTADPAGTFRGGFYVDTVINGSGCKYVTTAHDVKHFDYSTGFRCCAD